MMQQRKLLLSSISSILWIAIAIAISTTSAWVSSPSLSLHQRQSISRPISRTTLIRRSSEASSSLSSSSSSSSSLSSQDQSQDDEAEPKPKPKPRKSTYNLGVGKNVPVTGIVREPNAAKEGDVAELHWYAPEPVQKPPPLSSTEEEALAVATAGATASPSLRRTRKMVARTEESSKLRGAIWHEDHYDIDGNGNGDQERNNARPVEGKNGEGTINSSSGPRPPARFYPDIDLSIPESVYSNETDSVWDLLRWEAMIEAEKEPMLVSFLHSSILNHNSLESCLAFLLANRLSSPAMISTQIQSLILQALEEDASIGKKLRADIMAVRDRDPACTCLPDVFLYFKGFHALQTYRVANVLWNKGKHVLAHYLQSQMSQIFQIDIHPNATLGSGIMLDHGTGIVIGETAHVGHNCSILHHVTLGGSGKKGVDRHPKVGDGVLLGAGASVLGNVKLGDGCQVGAGTLVITDLPPHSVAVGVPAKIIGSFVDVTEQPSIKMDQMMDTKMVTFQSDGI